MKNYSIPTTAKAMYNMANELVRLMTCPLGGMDDQRRIARIESALDQVPNKYYKVIGKLIDRQLNAYNMPNEEGFSASDMDQAILRASGC